MDFKDLMDGYESISRDFPLPQYSISILHGKMKPADKDAEMKRFVEGKTNIMVATTVIEVGVDVPNATVMVIMDADRFGVSQLHQLRGRVGRGSVPGLCLLVTSAQEGTQTMERLTAVAGTLDGFELARIDLEQRKEGDVLGSSQSGGKSHLRLLRVLRDEDLIERARVSAQKLLSEDSTLNNYPELLAEVNKLREEESSAFMDKS